MANVRVQWSVLRIESCETNHWIHGSSCPEAEESSLYAILFSFSLSDEDNAELQEAEGGESVLGSVG